jgi:hypothetical protein
MAKLGDPLCVSEAFPGISHSPAFTLEFKRVSDVLMVANPAAVGQTVLNG